MSFWKSDAGLFSKIKAGLSKTSQLIKDGFKKIIPFGIGNTQWIEDIELFEQTLIEADLGVAYVDSLLEEFKEKIKKTSSREDRYDWIKERLKQGFMSIDRKIEWHGKPLVMMVSGINGSGKTTSIAKMAYQLKKEGKQVMIAACDTFRAAAVPQIEVWANRLGVALFKMEEKSDPAAVAYKATVMAQENQVDVLLLDTAGRLHNHSGLMDELSKIQRVVQKLVPPEALKSILILDGHLGQNSIVQAQKFSDAISIDALIITKLDGSAKGGALLSIESQLSIPVRWIGVGEGLEDMVPFDPEQFVAAILPEMPSEQPSERV